jgi:CHASE2 domain-containing sensor protein
MKILTNKRCRFLLLPLLALGFLPSPGTSAHAQSRAETTTHPFELVLIDAASEKQLGGFPVDRKLVAQAVTALKASGAKGVVLKFFYDQPAKLPESDKALAEAISSTKTLLQARIDEAEFGPNPLPQRFAMDKAEPNLKSAFSGDNGWIPMPQFANAAHDIGFVDITTSERVPMVESYKNTPVNSLTLAALELATGETGQIENGTRLTLGSKSVALTADNQVALKLNTKETLDYIDFSDVLEGSAAAMSRVRGKVVVIAYDGVKAESIHTSAGPIKAHRLFYMGLLDVWRQLK